LAGKPAVPRILPLSSFFAPPLSRTDLHVLCAVTSEEVLALSSPASNRPTFSREDDAASVDSRPLPDRCEHRSFGSTGTIRSHITFASEETSSVMLAPALESAGHCMFRSRGLSPPQRLAPRAGLRNVASCSSHGVRCVSTCPTCASTEVDAMSATLSRSALPFEEFRSQAAVPHHCGRCPLVVTALQSDQTEVCPDRPSTAPLLPELRYRRGLPP